MTIASSYPRIQLNSRFANYFRVAWGFLTGSPKRENEVDRIERAVTKHVGSRHAIAMPMARTAIYCAVKALVQPARRKVVLSPYTIADVVNMVICAGGVPIFADLSPGSCNVSAEEIEKLIDAETGAVLVTHFYGEACDIDRILAICKARYVPLIEDAAQSFGVKVDGRFTGAIGDVGVFSFGMYKNVNAYYGGMLITDRDDIASAVRSMMRDLPLESAWRYLAKVAQGLIVDVLTWVPIFRLFTFWLFRWAYLNDVRPITNQFKIDADPKIKREIPQEYLRRMTSVQAQLILPQLANVEAGIKARVRNAQRYHADLKDLPGLILPPLRTDGSHGYYYYCIQYPEREKLVRFAQLRRRDIQESYHRNCAALLCFGNYQRDCPNAGKVADALIYLPAYPGYPDSEIDRTVKVIREFLGASRG